LRRIYTWPGFWRARLDTCGEALKLREKKRMGINRPSVDGERFGQRSTSPSIVDSRSTATPADKAGEALLHRERQRFQVLRMPLDVAGKKRQERSDRGIAASSARRSDHAGFADIERHPENLKALPLAMKKAPRRPCRGRRGRS